jgi:hypothetical protein
VVAISMAMLQQPVQALRVCQRFSMVSAMLLFIYEFGVLQLEEKPYCSTRQEQYRANRKSTQLRIVFAQITSQAFNGFGFDM